MDGTFVDYADTSIKANRLFANLDGLSYFGMNAFIVVVYFLAGGRISAGNFQNRRHHRHRGVCDHGAVLI